MGALCKPIVKRQENMKGQENKGRTVPYLHCLTSKLLQ